MSAVLTSQKQSTDWNALPHNILLHTLEVTEDMFTKEAVVPNHFELVYIHNRHYDCIVSQETGKLSATLPTLTESHTFVTEIL